MGNPIRYYPHVLPYSFPSSKSVYCIVYMYFSLGVPKSYIQGNLIFYVHIFTPFDSLNVNVRDYQTVEANVPPGAHLTETDNSSP